MIEHRPGLTFLTHATLFLAVAVIAFPIYVAIAVSTQSFEEARSIPVSIVPTTHLVENYSAVLTHGSAEGSKAPVGRMMLNSFIVAIVVAVGKIAISILSAFAM